MFERFKATFRTVKESATWPAIISLGIHGPVWMSANYEAFAREGYIWNPDVFSCVSRKVEAMRGLKFGVYQTKGTGQKLIKDGDLANLLRHPNPRQSWSEIAGQWLGSKCISGNAYLEGVSPSGKDSKVVKPPRELYILRPDRVFIVAGTAALPIAGHQYNAGSLIVNYPAQMWRNPATGGLQPRLQLMHSKYWHPLDDFYGLSPIQSASRNIDSTNSATAHNVSLVQQFGRPSGIFSSAQPVSASQAEEFSNIIRQKFSGPGNAGRPLVLPAGYTWQQLGLTPVEMDWLKSLEYNTTKICSVFGVPPELIGDSANRTYSNFQEARKFFYLETMLPEAQSFCDDLNTWLTPLFSNSAGEELSIGIDREAIEAIQEDRQVKWANAKDGTGWLRVNEQRALLGYEPIPEGEVVMVPVGMVPLVVAGAQRQMPGQANAQPAKPQALPPGKPAKKELTAEPQKALPAPAASIDEHLKQLRQRIDRWQ